MLKKLTLLLALASAVSANGTEFVDRCGFSIPIPDGWRQGVGTCTGDVIFSREDATSKSRISFLIGERRYRTEEEEFVTSGDLYRASYFDDFRTAVPEALQLIGARLTESKTIQSANGQPILIFSFEGFPSDSDSARMKVFVALRESRTGGSAIELQCGCTADLQQEAESLFHNALAALTQ